MERNYIEEERYLAAKKKVKKIKGFYVHLLVYVLVNLFLLVSIYLNLDEDESIFQFGHFTTAIFWGIGVVIHGISTFGLDMIFGKNWEERKIKEYMDKEENH